MAIFSRNDIAIDLGTVNTIVRNSADSVLFNEATCVVLDSRYDSRNIIAMGNQAKKMTGRTHRDLEVINPLVYGAISDFDATKIFMQALLERCKKGNFSPKVGISIPQNLTQVERHSLHEATILAGAKEVFLIEDPFSASVGAGVNIISPRGSMVIDAGGGLVEVSIISLGGLVKTAYTKEAGNHLDLVLVEYLRHHKNISVSKEMAEMMKKQIRLGASNEVINIRAKDLISGMPMSYDVDLEELRVVLLKEILKIKQVVIEAIYEMPPQIASDIIEDGAILTGGMCLMDGFKDLLEEELKIKINLSPNPLLDISKGLYLIMQNYELYSQF